MNNEDISCLIQLKEGISRKWKKMEGQLINDNDWAHKKD